MNFKKQLDPLGFPSTLGKKTNADGKGSGQHNFTSVLSSDKKKITKKIFRACFLVQKCCTKDWVLVRSKMPAQKKKLVITIMFYCFLFVSLSLP